LELAAGPSLSRRSGGGFGLIGSSGLAFVGNGASWSAGLRVVAAIGFAF
jgi:hypothetical protein